MQMTSTPVPVDPWVVRWLSAPRFATYLQAACNDPRRALDLYEWNAQLSAAVLRDLAHIEIGLRNAYDDALSQHWPGRTHWARSPGQIFAPLTRTRNGRRVDINARMRDHLEAACRRVSPTAPPGKIVAELPLGFWRYLSSAAHEKTLWVRYLYHAFPPGTDRKADVDDRVRQLHALRNRVAHHEPLLSENIRSHIAAGQALAHMLIPSLAQHIASTSSVLHVVSQRP
jgi:hypothetical protein